MPVFQKAALLQGCAGEGKTFAPDSGLSPWRLVATGDDLAHLNQSCKFQNPGFFKKPGFWPKRGCANHSPSFPSFPSFPGSAWECRFEGSDLKRFVVGL